MTTITAKRRPTPAPVATPPPPRRSRSTRAGRSRLSGPRPRSRWPCWPGSSRPARQALDGPSAVSAGAHACLTAGLVWQFVLVVTLVPASSGRCAGRASARRCGCRASQPGPAGAEAGVADPARAARRLRGRGAHPGGPSGRRPRPADVPRLGRRPRVPVGSWGWFAVFATLAVFNTVLGEELLFRGLLLPADDGAFGEPRLGRQRRAVRRVSPAHAMGHPGRPRSTRSSSPIPPSATAAP